MQITLSTKNFQKALMKAVKCASCNKMIPLTNYLCISAKDGLLTITTTDATNYLYVRENVQSDEEFYAVVPVEVLYKLVDKTTVPQITFSVEDDIMTVNGNGDYKIALPLNEEGVTITYPNPLDACTNATENSELSEQDANRMIITARASTLKSKNMIGSCYSGYYVGDKIITSDMVTICGIDTKLFDNSYLFRAETVELLPNLEFPARVNFFDNTVVFSSNSCTLLSTTLPNINEFQYDVISSLLNSEFTGQCTVDKNTILPALDRLSLFVDTYDDNTVKLTFTETGIDLQSKQSTSIEHIDCVVEPGSPNFTCYIVITALINIIKAISSNTFSVEFGRDNSIKLCHDITTQIIALEEVE